MEMKYMGIKMTICFPMLDGETKQQAKDRLIERIDPDEDAIMSWRESDVMVYDDTQQAYAGATKDAIDAAPVIRCKDCDHRGEDECPMRHVESYYHTGWEEWDEIVDDYTTDNGYCDRALRRTE